MCAHGKVIHDISIFLQCNLIQLEIVRSFQNFIEKSFGCLEILLGIQHKLHNITFRIHNSILLKLYLSLYLQQYQLLSRVAASWGSISQAQPVFSRLQIALTTSRISTVRGCHPGLTGGINGSSSRHSLSVRSLLQAFRRCRKHKDNFGRIER